MNKQRDIISKLVNHVLNQDFSDEIIAIYGVGSFFDDTLPRTWIHKDIDVVVVMEDLNNVPKKEWTSVPFLREMISHHEIYYGFNTLKGLQDKDTFTQESFSNYEWSLMDLKVPENSELLHGQNIRSMLPKLDSVSFDYDDLLNRCFYHLDKSLRRSLPPEEPEEARISFTKSVFKFCFYYCVFLDPDFHDTSIRAISNEIEGHVKRGMIKEVILEFLRSSIMFRQGNDFKGDFAKLRMKFAFHVFSSLSKGRLHCTMKYEELSARLLKGFGSGFTQLLNLLKKIRERRT